MTFGDFIKDRRIHLGLSLRSFCSANGYDPGNHSKLERGILNPPENDGFMSDLGRALDIKRDSSEWQELCSLAHVARGQIPKTLLDDNEVAAKLPALLRTLDGNPLPSDKIDDLIEFIRHRG